MTGLLRRLRGGRPSGMGGGALGRRRARRPATEIAPPGRGAGKPVAVQSMYPESPSCRADRRRRRPGVRRDRGRGAAPRRGRPAVDARRAGSRRCRRPAAPRHRRAATSAPGGCSPTPACRSRPRVEVLDGGRAPRRRRRDRRPVRAQGAAPAAQVGRRRRASSGCRDVDALVAAHARDARAARRAGVLGRGDGRPVRRRRADRRRQRRPAVRAGRDGRARRRLHRGAPRRRVRARARTRRSGRGPAADAAVGGAARRARAAGPPSTSRPRPTSIARITAVAAAHPEIAEIEVNPLLVSPPRRARAGRPGRSRRTPNHRCRPPNYPINR